MSDRLRQRHNNYANTPTKTSHHHHHNGNGNGNGSSSSSASAAGTGTGSTFTMDSSSTSDGGPLHHHLSQQHADYHDDDLSSACSNASGTSTGSNSRRNKPKKSPGRMEHIDEEQGYQNLYEMMSLHKNDSGSGGNNNNMQLQQQQKHRQKSGGAAIDHGHGDNNNDKFKNESSSVTPLSEQDADDTKNKSQSDVRSRTLFLKTAFWISCWYATSLATLFLNKIILSRPGSSVHVLGMCQMTTAAVLGGWSTFGGAQYIVNTGMCVLRSLPEGVQSRFGLLVSDEKEDNIINSNNSAHATSESGTPSKPDNQNPAAGGMGFHFVRDMSIVGVLRGLTVVLGLIALEHVPVSFVETIKATAPAFTVVFARLILAERTATPVMLTLIPVVAGLVLCSASELRFDLVGFVAAVMNNCADCVQNVMSKRMLARLKPTQLQFYTSVAALALQTPFVLRDATSLVRNWAAGKGGDEMDVLEDNGALMEGEDASFHQGLSYTQLLIIDAVFYHLQSVSAYCTMGCMSPVSQSVANTLKRALLVWASILYFGNPVTNSGIVGIAMVVSGVFLYNHVRRIYQS